jgi:inosose dehydratase
VRSLLERVAGAPITWGVCEVPGWGHRLEPERVLAEMSGIGLRATELGPEGYLPEEPEPLHDLLASFGLSLVGGFVPVVLHREEEIEAQLALVSRSVDLLASGGAEVLVLAASIGDDGYAASAELGADEWSTLATTVDRVAELAAARGLTAALHPHHGTVVQTPQQVTRLLESSSIPLCLDTGHLVVGGADPIEVARSAGDRVAHVHLKDVIGDLAEQVRAGRMGYHEAVRLGLYRALGAGDLDVAGLVREVERSGYRGWYVLEQDTVLDGPPEDGAGPMRDASASLAFLERVAREVGIEARS